MNTVQIACLQKLVNVLQECEHKGITFSHTYLRLDVEDNESHYLEELSSEKLSTLLNFIDGCAVFKSDEPIALPENLQTAGTFIGYDDGGRVGDNSCTIEMKDGVVTKWEISK